MPTEELWEETDPACAKCFPPPRTSGSGQPRLDGAAVPGHPLGEGIGAAAQLGEPQEGPCPGDANWGSALACFILASIRAGQPEAGDARGWRRGQLSGCSPLCAHIPSSEYELMGLFSVKFFVSLGNPLKWVKTRHL